MICYIDNVPLSEFNPRRRENSLIQITPIDDELLGTFDDDLFYQGCYLNAIVAMLAFANAGYDTTEIKYVLGYSESQSYWRGGECEINTIQHGIIKVGKEYHDPTFQFQGLNIEQNFYVCAEFTFEEAIGFVLATRTGINNFALEYHGYRAYEVCKLIADAVPMYDPEEEHTYESLCARGAGVDEDDYEELIEVIALIQESHDLLRNDGGIGHPCKRSRQLNAL